MKRFYILLALLLCAMLAFSAQAATVAPGETVEIPVSISTNDAYMVKVKVTYNADVFEYIGIACPAGQANNGIMSLYSIEGVLPSGQIGTVTFKIKEGVKNGTYGVNVALVEAWTLDEDFATVSVSSGTVTVYSECKHATTEDKIIKDADCENEGSKEIVCADCGEVMGTETIEALGHDAGEWKVTKEATCTEKGEETSACSRCGETDTREIEALGHDVGEWKVTKEATCTEKGEETATCSRCGEADTREIEALGHDVGEWKVTKEATCTEKGEETATCSRCNEADTREIEALGHDVGEWKVTKEPTCTEKGEETATCARCGKTDTREVAALGHNAGAWEVTKAATCTEKGEETSTCSRCGETNTREVAALGHNAVWKVIKPATREEEGLKQKICKRCNEILEEQVLPILKVAYKTACTAGIKISEITTLVDKNDHWKMVTPIDLSVEGTTRYPLIAGNVYEIGYVEVTVANGVVTADLVVEANVTMYTTSLILLSDASEIKRFSANDYEHYDFPASINISDLPSDKMYMMVACQLTIDMAKPEPKYYNFKGAEHAALLESLNEIMG